MKKLTYIFASLTFTATPLLAMDDAYTENVSGGTGLATTQHISDDRVDAKKLIRDSKEAEGINDWKNAIFLAQRAMILDPGYMRAKVRYADLCFRTLFISTLSTPMGTPSFSMRYNEMARLYLDVLNNAEPANRKHKIQALIGLGKLGYMHFDHGSPTSFLNTAIELCNDKPEYNSLRAQALILRAVHYGEKDTYKMKKALAEAYALLAGEKDVSSRALAFIHYANNLLGTNGWSLKELDIYEQLGQVDFVVQEKRCSSRTKFLLQRQPSDNEANLLQLAGEIQSQVQANEDTSTRTQPPMEFGFVMFTENTQLYTADWYRDAMRDLSASGNKALLAVATISLDHALRNN